MVRIDDTIKKVITDIKLEEARIAHLQNSIGIVDGPRDYM
jgi:hypothetical protein